MDSASIAEGFDADIARLSTVGSRDLAWLCSGHEFNEVI